MVDVRFEPNKNVDVWFLLDGTYANANSPTDTEINNGIWLNPGVAFANSTFPTATDSSTESDPTLEDESTAVSLGSANFDAVLNMNYPKILTETNSDYGKIYNHFRKLGVKGILVTRISQRSASGVPTLAAAGQWISVYKSITDGWELDIEGDTSYKYTMSYLPQGLVVVNTQVKNTTPITLTNKSASSSLTVGDHAVVWATLGGHYATQAVEWSSSNPNVATVSPNGVVTAISLGTANITATAPSATGATTPISFTVT